jgi:hypothetical protein
MKITDIPENLADLKKDPLGSERMFEYINQMDETINELGHILDSQGSDVLKLIIYIEAIQAILLSKNITTPEEIQECVVEASSLIAQQVLSEENDDETGVDDIEV